EAVGGRHEHRPARAESRIDTVTDHHARHAGLDRRTVRREVRVAHSTDDVGPFVGGKRQRAETREVLDAGTGATRCEPACKRDAEERGTKLPRAEWAVGQVEHGCEIDVHTDAPERAPCRPAGVEGLRLAPHCACGRLWRQLWEGLDLPTLLVCDDERAAWPRRVAIVFLHDHTGHPRWSR